MTTKDVLAIALDALEEHDGNYAQSNASAARVIAAITAIKQAQEPVSDANIMSKPKVIKFGHIEADADGNIVVRNFRIDADGSTDCEEMIVLDAVINLMMAERELYITEQASQAITPIKQAQDDHIEQHLDMVQPQAQQAQEPDLSGLQPQTQERIRGWLADGTFVCRAIGTMQEQEREIMAYAADAAPKQAGPAIKESLIAPEGYKLVPVEPTKEIMEAAISVYDVWAWRNFQQMWAAMLAAAPTPPEAA